MTRCSKCNRLKLIGGGWKSLKSLYLDQGRAAVLEDEYNELMKSMITGEDIAYCPECWAKRLKHAAPRDIGSLIEDLSYWEKVAAMSVKAMLLS